MALVLGMGGVYGVPGATRQPSLTLPELRRPTFSSIQRRFEPSTHYPRPDGFHTMSFVSLGDITTCADRVDRLYEYGWSNVRNPSTQYHEFGQDIHRLYENLGQLEKVFQSVQARSTRKIPAGHAFYDASSLNTILEEPFKTIKGCRDLLRRRDSFSEERGAIKNIYWNILIEADVAQLHTKVKCHNVKIVALLKPLEIKLLLDIKSMIYDNGDQLLSKLTTIEEKLFGNTPPPACQIATRCEQIQIPKFLIDKFEEASRGARPELQDGGVFPMHQGINAFLSHYKQDAASSQFSGGFLLETPTQSPEHFLRMMKTIWIIQRVRNSREYTQACQSGNRLLKCFVESLGQKCVEDFNRFAQSPPGNVFRVRNEPDMITLSQMGDESFAIWPNVVRPLDIFDTASMDSLKIVFRALLRPPPTLHLAPMPSRYKQLLLLRHDNTLLELIIKETSETDSSTNSQSKNIDLTTVSLNPIYADPDNQSQAAMDLGLNTMGNRGSDDHLSFQAYNDLYQFQEAITGYRPILDLLDVDLIIHQDSNTQWKARVQLWNSQAVQTGPAQDASPSSSRRPSLVPSGTPSSYQTSPTSQHSSIMSFQTRTSQVTAVTSFVETEDEVGMNIDATTFEPPKQPVLVLFLRPRGLPSHAQSQHLSLMKISMSQKSVLLNTKNCSCRPNKKCDCKHSELTGLPKTFVGNKPLMVQRYADQELLNLALLGAHHERRGKQAEQKLNYISFTFSSVRDREVFDAHFREYQRLYARRMDIYEREKRSIRFRRETGSPT